MLEELSVLFSKTGINASRAEYRTRIVEDNCLGKRTVSTRKLTNQRLGELYGLNPSLLLFRAMRRFWQADENGRPLLAVLLALARDPLLRFTAPTVLNLRPGEELGRHALNEALGRETSSRFNEAILDKIVRNSSSSWTQSGHLEGRVRKIRRIVRATPTSAAFALLLGYILGARGTSLFDTMWTKVLHATQSDLVSLATDARRLGLLKMSQAGGIIDVAFPEYSTHDERRMTNGKD